MSTSKKQRRLGRGLSSLIETPVRVSPPAEMAADASDIGESTGPKTGTPRSSEHPVQAFPGDVGGGSGDVVGGLVEIELSRIVPSPFQPRRVFGEGARAGLAASIRRTGLMQPVIVRGGSGGGYELVAGERRWRAAALAGLERIPALVRDLDDESSAEWAVVENLQRADLDPMERADALRSLMDRFGLTQAQVAERVGVDRSSVANFVRLTELEPAIRAMLSSGELSVGHGKVLCGLAPGEARVTLAARAREQGWTVRRMEQELRGPAMDPAPSRVVPRRGAAQSEHVAELERQLGEHLGTRVRVRTIGDGTKGRLELAFFGLDHFDDLMSRLGFVTE